MSVNYPKCNHNHLDCFALRMGDRCGCLRDTRFSGKDCPFYKTRKQVRDEDPDYKFIKEGR